MASGQPAVRLQAMLERTALLGGLEDVVRSDFVVWLGRCGVEEPLAEPRPHLEELLSEWRSSPEYERTKAERIAAVLSSTNSDGGGGGGACAKKRKTK